jgi:hypothetical protein
MIPVARQQFSCRYWDRGVKLPVVLRSAIDDPTQTYRREARRLRSRYADRPAQLYKSLRSLSARHDLQQARSEFSIRLRHSAKDEMASPCHEFARLVEGQVEGGVLRYSNRAQLLLAAQEIGIGRFQANLVIATVQHQNQMGMTDSQAEPSSRVWVSGFVAVTVLQSLITATAYAFFVCR